MIHQQVPVASIRLDGGTQARVSLNNETVAEYAEVLRAGGELPRVIVFFDGTDNWLADGFHRTHAYRHADRVELPAEVRDGTRRDAVLFACGANASHGLRRTSADKRKAVETLLADPEWQTWSDRDIAKACGVSHPFVAAIRNPERAQAQQEARERNVAKRLESDSTPPAAPRPVVSAAGAAVVIEPPRTTHPAVLAPPAEPTEAEKLAAEAHGDADLVTLLDETQRDLEAANRTIEAMKADDKAAAVAKWQRIADVAQRRQEEIQARLVEREAELSRLMNTLRRVGRAVGEDDVTKIAATVETFVRTMKVAA